MELKIEKLIIGPVETNAYVVVNEQKRVLIIDPSSGCEELLLLISEKQYIPEAIVLTHGHFDHVMGIPEMVDKFPDLPVYIHPNEKVMLTHPEMNGSPLIGMNWTYNGAVNDLKEGSVTIGSFDMQVIAVPGHSIYGCALLFDRHCVCGDILFAGSVGRSDLPGGNGPLLIKGIREKLLPLPEDTIVYPGHGGRTTIGREKRSNPYL